MKIIKNINTWKKLNENILVPRNLDSRKEKLRQDLIKLLSQKVIEGDIRIDETFLEVPEDLIKVKEIHGDVILDLYHIPKFLKDIDVYGNFNCVFCELSSLENCPRYVSGDFSCSNNNLTSLEGCPKYIGGYFFCWNNKEKLQLPKDVKVKGVFVNE